MQKVSAIIAAFVLVTFLVLVLNFRVGHPKMTLTDLPRHIGDILWLRNVPRLK